VVRLNGLYCPSIQHPGEYDRWRGKEIQKHCKQFGKAHSHSQVLFNNLWFAAMPTHGFLISCTTIKSNSKFTIEWLGESTKKRIHLFLFLCLSSHYIFSSSIDSRISCVGGGRRENEGGRMREGRNFLRVKNKLQIACPCKNLVQ